MILADTNAWYRYAIQPRVPDVAFGRLVEEGEVVCHPWIYAELMLGGLTESRARLIRRLEFLPVASHEDALRFVVQYRPQGIGWVDVNLLVSVLQAGATLLTLDEGLLSNAERHGRAHRSS